MLSKVVIGPFHRAFVSAERRRPQVVPSLTCVLFTGSHDGVDPQPYVLGPTQRPATVCRGCLTVVSALTDAFPDRRR